MTISEAQKAPVVSARNWLVDAALKLAHVTRNDPGVKPADVQRAMRWLLMLQLLGASRLVPAGLMVKMARALYRNYSDSLGKFGGRAILETALLNFVREIGRPLTPEQLAA